MEIHAPEHPLQTWQDILLHLGIVTVGILIAIGLDAVVEWQHHRNLAEEARANIRSEMRDNRAKLADMIKEISATEQEQVKTMQVLKGVLVHHPKQMPNMGLHWGGQILVNSSWTTAQTMGALSYMPYEEVKKYAAIYDLQGLVVENAHRAQQATATAIGALATAGPEGLSDWEVKDTIGRIQQTWGITFSEEQIGKNLVSAYDDVLKEK
jgi:hypothetical protein